MAPPDLSHRRTHNLLLLSKLLNLRDNASPFTLILDSLEQPANILLKEYTRRANAARNPVVFVSFETLRCPPGVDTFVTARKKSPPELSRDISQAIQHSKRVDGSPKTCCLVIFDSLQPLCAQAEVYLPTYLSSLLVPSATLQVSLVAVYHSDVPLAPSRAAISDYTPSPLTLLNYLATTIMTLHSFKQFLARKTAADRSVEAPPFGLEEGKEGVLIGLHGASTWSNVSNSTSDIRSSVIIEMEYRRKSGRSVGEWFSITAITDFSTSANGKNPQTAKENFTLLDDHPLLKIHDLDLDPASDVGPQSTFSLSLTERQKREREGVVLPYFDAQNADGEGEGGRILYDMGVEDDFDEEEDEI